MLPHFRVTCTAAREIINTASVFTVASSGPITVRCRHSGDVIRLSGGTKSLKKLFIDRKVPADRRLQIPVLVDETGVLAVYGVGVDVDKAAKELPAWQIQIVEL
jgi:tRNA(Ile)-lysidine synthase